MAQEETSVLDTLFEFVVGIADVSFCLTHGKSLVVDILLNVFEQGVDVIGYAGERCGFFFKRVTAHQFDCAVLDVACSDYKTNWHAFEFVVGELEARALVVGVVILDGDSEFVQTFNYRHHFFGDGGKLFCILEYRYDYNLYRSQMRRQNKAVVVGVGHDKGAHQACRYAP